MGNDQNPESTDSNVNTPTTEELQTQSDSSSIVAEDQMAEKPLVVVQAAARRRAAYKPSHKATFIGLSIMAVILIVNAVGLAYILRNQSQEDSAKRETVTLSTKNLDQLGVSRNSVGSEGVTLTVNPDANFSGKVTIAGDAAVGGALKLSGTFSATTGSFAKLQGGDTALEKLNVNGDATATNLILRRDLTVTGATQLQGQVTVGQLMTVNNNLNVTGSLAVGGALSVRTLQVGDLRMTGNLTFGGHIITSGATPSVSAGGAVGSGGTASGSGNDAGGTIAVNVGVGAGTGTLANITFRTKYADTPHVVVTAIGRYVPFYINRSATGFSIVTTSALSPGGYAFDYVIMQ